jgi:hypothetical protein
MHGKATRNFNLGGGDAKSKNEGKGMEFASFTIGWSRGVVKLLSMLKKWRKEGGSSSYR